MSRVRVHLRPEGLYFLCVVLFVLGGAVLRNVNLLVGLAGLMVATLLIHYQLIVRQLAGLDVERELPSRICVGDLLEIGVTITRRLRGGDVFALQYLEQVTRLNPASSLSPGKASLFFAEIKRGQSITQRYTCQLARRGAYAFSHAELQCRYPFGLLEGSCFVPLSDRLIVCPRPGELSRAWQSLLSAEHEGQMRSRHRRGLLEAEFYALREWRNGDSRRWIHWRTSAKLGQLSVRQFEERDACDLALVCDLWQESASDEEIAAHVEEVISFAATILIDLARQGGARITFVLAGRVFQLWQAAASSLFAWEMLEQLAVCESAAAPDLTTTDSRLRDTIDGTARVIVLSTRQRDAALAASEDPDVLLAGPLGQAIWLCTTSGDHAAYFTADHSHIATADAAEEVPS